MSKFTVDEKAEGTVPLAFLWGAEGTVPSAFYYMNFFSKSKNFLLIFLAKTLKLIRPY